MTFTQPVVDIPRFLIEHWFKSVCGSWSAHDSQVNPYRRLTGSLWTTSVPIFYALQAISAASLVERLPHVMRESARAAPRLATEAIMKELHAFAMGQRPGFPSDLLLALFCMSSSLCWLEARELGLQYVRQARSVLKFLNHQSWKLGPGDRQLLDFFNGCLIYEEMLRSVVSDEEVDFDNMLGLQDPLSSAPVIPATPHPWTGVSAAVLRLFGKAMTLCRRSRSRWRNNNWTSYRILQGAMKDIEEARSVEEALLAIEPDLTQVHITDQARQVHLHDATEAYRLASLLQLYETFPDLITKRLPPLAEADDSAVWDAWVSPLAFHITDVIERIPSGAMRCIQTLICLCAGTGLRFATKVPMQQGPYSYLMRTEPGTPDAAAAEPPSVGGTVDDLAPPPPAASENAVKTSRARHAIMMRLDELELTLPPKPIGVAKQLLRAVWSAYDEEIDMARRTHWLDVMSYTGLHSLFG